MSTGSSNKDVIIKVRLDTKGFEAALKQASQAPLQSLARTGKITTPKLGFDSEHGENISETVKNILKGQAESKQRRFEVLENLGKQSGDPLIKAGRAAEFERKNSLARSKGDPRTQAGLQFADDMKIEKQQLLANESVQLGLMAAFERTTQAAIALGDSHNQLARMETQEASIRRTKKLGEILEGETPEDKAKVASGIDFGVERKRNQAKSAGNPLVQEGQLFTDAMRVQRQELNASTNQQEALRAALQRTTAAAERLADPHVQLGQEGRAKARFDKLQREGEILAGDREADVPELDREAAIAAQTAAGKRGAFLRFGDAIDRVSTSLLKGVNPAHKTNGQIADSAQIFLALGGILAPLNAKLGMTALQMGFSAFSLGGVGIALTGVSIAAGAAIKGLLAWNTKTYELAEASNAAGRSSLSASKASRDLNNALQESRLNMGAISSEGVERSTRAYTAFVKTLTDSGGIVASFHRDFLSFVDSIKTIVFTNLQGAAGAAQILGGITGNTGGNTIQSRIQSGDYFNLSKNLRFLIDQAANLIDWMSATKQPADAFIAGLTGMERTLLLSGEALTKFSAQASRSQMTRPELFGVNQRNLAESIKSKELTLDEASRAAAIEFEKTFRGNFQPSIQSLEASSTGIVAKDSSNLAEKLTEEQIRIQKLQLIELTKLSEGAVEKLERIGKNTETRGLN